MHFLGEGSIVNISCFPLTILRIPIMGNATQERSAGIVIVTQHPNGSTGLMDTEHFDVVIIGGGSAGYAAARIARATRDRVAIVDGADELGGLCILRGCMPSKTLLYTAEIYHYIRHAERFALPAMAPHPPDMRAVRERKRRIIAEFAEHRRNQLESNRFHIFRSDGRFADGNTLELSDGRRLTADAFVVATGSDIQTPPIPGLAETPFLTSDDILDLDHLPASIVALGGGVVACELAQYLSRMGCQVILIQRSPQLLREYTVDSAEAIRAVFEEEGIAVYTDTAIESIASTGDGVRVRFKHAGTTTRTVDGAALFNALGRRPSTARLNLEAAGVETTPDGRIRTDAMQRTSNPRIYAAGDCAGPHEIVHVAILQGETAARHATGQPAEPVQYDWLTSVLFTDPQAAFAGIPEAQLRERNIAFLCAEFPFDDHGKSILMEARHGYVKVWAEQRSGRILAAECVGKDGGELIHALAVALPLGATVDDLLKAHWYHPTLSEIWTYPLEEPAERLNGECDRKN